MCSTSFCRALDRTPDAQIGAAATEIVCKRLVDFYIGGMGVLLQQGNRRQDLPRLAVSAL
jgi:hypothetical protein